MTINFINSAENIREMSDLYFHEAASNTCVNQSVLQHSANERTSICSQKFLANHCHQKWDPIWLPGSECCCCEEDEEDDADPSAFELGAAATAGNCPSVHWTNLCSGLCVARKWSCSSRCENEVCIWRPSCSRTWSPVMAYKSLRMADAHNWTWTSGILDASCMAGVTMFIDSRVFPRERKMCPSRTREQEVSLLRSSALAILRVSRRKRFESLYFCAKNACSPWM